MTTSKSFIDYLIALQTRDSSIRIGQHMFNTLCDYNLQLSRDIRGELNTIDPFYNDKKVPAFLKYIMDNWNKYDKLNT
jgi:hypothetical protein